MLCKRALLVLTLTPLVLLLAGQNINSDIKLKKEIDLYGQAHVSVPYSSVSHIDELSLNVSITSVRDKIIFITLSKNTADWFILQHFDYTIIPKEETKGIATARNTTAAMDWHSYPTYLQYDSIMHFFASEYPAICRLDTIGETLEGRNVLVLKISDNAGADEDEPEVFYSSTMHGDEIAGYVLMLRLADFLTENYTASENVRELVDNLEIWINPLANPDGTYASGNEIVYPTRGNSNGVDLNRNFPDPAFTSHLIEKENLDMVSFLKKHNFIISANFHSGVEVVNYPWDRWYSTKHADDLWFNSVSRAYADTVHNYSLPSYMDFLDNGVTRGAVWYVIHGGRQDYVTWERQGREVTIELDDIILTPSAQLEQLWQYNYNSLLYYLKNAFYGIHGTVKDLNTNEPLAARVFITGHDKDSSHVYSNVTDGRFVRLLYPGTWDLIFSAPGYRDTIFEDVNVTQGERTDLEVFLKSIDDQSADTLNDYPVIYPNPSSGHLYIKMPYDVQGNVTLRLFDLNGRLVSELNNLVFYNREISLNLFTLSPGIYFIYLISVESGSRFLGKLIITGQ